MSVCLRRLISAIRHAAASSASKTTAVRALSGFPDAQNSALGHARIQTARLATPARQARSTYLALAHAPRSLSSRLGTASPLKLRLPCAQITVDEHHDSLVHHRPIPSPPTQSSRCCLSPLAHAQVGDHELFAVVNVVAVVKASASSRSSPSRQGVGVVKASASTQLLDSPSRTSFTPP